MNRVKQEKQAVGLTDWVRDFDSELTTRDLREETNVGSVPIRDNQVGLEANVEESKNHLLEVSKQDLPVEGPDRNKADDIFIFSSHCIDHEG